MVFTKLSQTHELASRWTYLNLYPTFRSLAVYGCMFRPAQQRLQFLDSINEVQPIKGRHVVVGVLILIICAG